MRADTHTSVKHKYTCHLQVIFVVSDIHFDRFFSRPVKYEGRYGLASARHIILNVITLRRRDKNVKLSIQTGLWTKR